MLCKLICILGMCQKNDNTTNKKLLLKTKLVNKPSSYLQVYHLYLRNVIMYKRNKVSKFVNNLQF